MFSSKREGVNDDQALRRKETIYGKGQCHFDVHLIQELQHSLGLDGKVIRYGMVCQKHFPCYTLIIWMAIKVKLLARDKLLRYGVVSKATYCLFNKEVETIDHSFFNCEFSKDIQRKVLICWIRSIGRGFNLKSILGRMRLGAILYWLWRERNNSVLKGY